MTRITQDMIADACEAEERFSLDDLETYAANMVKQVGYAYATSDHAKLLGRYNDGCWFVETGQEGEPLHPVAGPFETEAEARTHAETMPEPWSACQRFVDARK